MKRKPRAVLACCLLVVAVLACEGSHISVEDEIRANEKTARPILQAIEAYKTGHGRLPEAITQLAPEYLSEVPSTVGGGTFEYKLDEVDGYYLCFRLAARRDRGCCYIPRWALWDCSPGAE